MAIDEKLLSFASRLRATLDAVNAELAAKGAAEAGDYSELPASVRSIKQGATLPTQEKSVSPSADVREVVPDEGYTLSKVTVSAAPLESGSAAPAASAKTYYPASGKYGFSQFKVGAIPSSYVQPASIQAAKTWTPKTSAQSIPAGTYCSGKQTIGAIPSSYVQPSYTEAGGTYILNPGESLSYNAKTYLTSALSVTAASASGGNGYIGSYVSANRNSSSSIVFSVSTENLIGFTVIAAENIEDISSNEEYCSAIMYNGSKAYWIAAGETYAGSLSNYIDCSIGSGLITVTIDGNAFPGGITYYLFPIYSK